MGIYLNKDNSEFKSMVKSEIYVDKTGLIKYTNKVVEREGSFICNSRPRRFGKSFAAKMLNAYYSKGANSRELFKDLEIEKDSLFGEYLNKYDTIHLDIQGLFIPAGGKEKVVDYINKSILYDLKEIYPSFISENTSSLQEALTIINSKTGNKFVIIIDEWDILIREAEESVANEYIDFLRGLFKCTEANSYIALAYLTGILPIKKIQTQSALNNFKEYTVTNPSVFATYFGFTKGEVKTLCEKYNRDYGEIQRWYDGYLLNGKHIYNPQSVVYSIQDGRTINYWTGTSSFDAIIPYINMNFDGLKDDIIKMLSGIKVPVNVSSFKNDLRAVNSKDDVITLLIHLGYLGYDIEKSAAFVPNEEIREELTNTLNECKWDEFVSYIQLSDKTLDNTVEKKEEEVAKRLEEIHDRFSSAIYYNNENSLASTILLSYLSTLKFYFSPLREFPTGKGFADIIYIPKNNYESIYPALIVELKWDKTADTAIRQIKEKNYPEALKDYSGRLLLVGAVYDRKTKKHKVKIEEVDKK